MRVLHVFDHSLPLQSGYVSRSLGIVRSQQSRGWETIHVTTPRHSAPGPARETVDGLTFFRTPQVGTTAPVLRELLEMRATRRRLAAVIRDLRPDILHAHSPVLNGIPAISAGRQFGLPVVYEIRAFWEDAAVDHGRTREGAIRYRASRWLETYAMRRADWVVAICDPLREEILARGIAASRVSVVPNAVDSSFLKPPVPLDASFRSDLGIEGRTVLGFIGSFYSYEGLDLLLEALPLLRRHFPDVTVLLVGGGPDEARLRQIVTETGLGDIVRFTGRVHHSDVARYYGAIDIFVYPRRRMRLTELVTPLKPLEAMAQRKPVVASDVGGHRELMRDSETGYLFAADSVEALVARLEAAIADPAGRARVGANGRRFVEEERTWDANVGRYAAIYEQLLGSTQAGRNGAAQDAKNI